MFCIYCCGAAANWWLRSPNPGNTNNFWYVNAAGNVNGGNNTGNSYGVAFGSSLDRQSNQKAKSDQIGEKESMTFRKVNIHPDVFGRTLLAWYRLKVMRYFMPSNTTLLL